METNKKKENKTHFHIHRERNKHNYKTIKDAGTNVSFETNITTGKCYSCNQEHK